MYVKIFDNYHAGVSLMPESEQDAFYGAVMRYAFDGTEPMFEGTQAAIWATIRPFIDKSLEGQENGSKGGNGRGNRNPSKQNAKTQDENQSEKDPSKTPAKKGGQKPSDERPLENQKKRKEGNRRENLKGFSSNSRASVGADADKSAPPSAQDDSRVPVCPLCSSPVRFDAKTFRWHCELCGDIKEPSFAEAVA